MSREIKFRLIQDKKIVGYLRLKDGWTQFQAIGRTDWYYPCDFKWTEAEQYTGLKDKNGKEIYEGDKVGGDNNTLLQGVVIWSDNDVGWRMKVTKGYYKDKIIGFVDDQLEIIGTIHDKEKP